MELNGLIEYRFLFLVLPELTIYGGRYPYTLFLAGQRSMFYSKKLSYTVLDAAKLRW